MRIKSRNGTLLSTEISEFVSAFFWDEAPDKYGLEAREGQQDMAFAILDAVRGNYHFAVEAGVGLGSHSRTWFLCFYIIRKQASQLSLPHLQSHCRNS